VNRQSNILAASGMAVGALAIIGGVFFWSKSEPNAQAQGTPPAQKPGQKSPATAQKPGQKQTPKGQQPGGVFSNNNKPATASAAGGMRGVPGATATPGQTPPVVVKLPYRPRRDPFALKWRIPPPPPYVFNEVEPIRIASPGVVTPPPPNTEVREVPSRRVSGIMSGDGVFAILEGTDGEPEIVKPGSETRDGYKVVSIKAETVTLRKKEGNIIRTQIVPLTDIPPGQAPQVGGAGRFGSGARGPGGAPTAGGLSGPGGGGRRGGGGSAGGALD
jgi:hypothetical protein